MFKRVNNWKNKRLLSYNRNTGFPTNTPQPNNPKGFFTFLFFYLFYKTAQDRRK